MRWVQSTEEEVPIIAIKEEYEEHLIDTIEKIIEEDYGIVGEAKIVTPTYENTQGLWSITIPLISLNIDVFLTHDPEETTWEDPVRFDKELTELENLEQENLEQVTASWQAIMVMCTHIWRFLLKWRNEHTYG